MSVELWGMESPFHLGLPLRLSGLVALAFLSAVLLLVFAFGGRRRAADETRLSSARFAVWAGLIVFAPFAAQLFLIRLNPSTELAAPGVPFLSGGTAFSLLGDLPWMLAAGWLGVRPAIVVGLAAGLARAGWETGSVLTPVGIGLQAGLVAMALRNPYGGWTARALRQPLLAAWSGAVLAGCLGAGESYFDSSGTLYDGLAYAVSALPSEVLAAAAQASIAGVIVTLFRMALPEFWYRPARLEAPPLGRTLSARMVSLYALLGVAALAAVSAGEWFLAQAAAEDLLEAEMRQAARQTAAGIPYFIQAGRSMVGELAAESAASLAGPVGPNELLEGRLRLVPFFSRLEIYDVTGASMASIPAASAIPAGLEFDSAVLAALAGVPQEILLPPEAAGRGAQMVFFSPMVSSAGGPVVGALAGWTDLSVNPFLQPVLAGLSQAAPGESFVVDDTGRIALDPSAARALEGVALDPASMGRLASETAPDGTRRLVLVQPVEGYPWRVVVRQPQSAVDRLAVQISSRLLGVMLSVGFVLLVSVYIVSRRLTRPLRVMSRIAESIARGNLAQPVPLGGDDELGRLAASFERMRLALRTRLEEMDLLLAASQQVASSFDLPQVLPRILEGVRDLTRADYVRLALEPSGGAEATFSAGTDPGRWSTLDEQVLSLARQHGRFVLENPARARAVLDQDGLERPIKALMGLPIRHEAAFVGVLWLAHRKPHAFSRDEVNLLSILGGQLGVAISNARLFQQAEQERLRLAAVLEATPDAVVVIDREGRILLANPAAESVLRGDPLESRGKQAVEWLVPPELLELLAAGDREARTTEVRLDGGRMLFASAAEVAGEGDEPLGRVIVLWDISHYKKLDTLKSEFVSTVSHDLRSPLTLMRGYATMLTMVGTTNDQQREFVRKILDSVDQMARLVDNLLDLGRIEAGVGLNLERLPLEPVLQDVVESLRPQAANKQIALRVQLEDGMEPVEVDPTLFRQAVANLVDNAIKYTPAGGSVTLRAFQADGRQSVRVEDTGLGIAPTDQARLFERFYRARRKETLREKGTGLGLAIVKSIVEQHGGRVSLESRLGAGSAFTLEIPVRQPARPAP
ncbi:MAG TPA: ATP-binding protein [Anaerolineales bacterium]